jgi:16S rRNA (guanine527-N7)-methyltransferase
MTGTEISEALAPFLGLGFQLSTDQLSSVQTYLDLLLKWNSKINLTAIREPEEIVSRHFGESFFAASQLPVRPQQTAIDIGSGAGFPGLPLKIWNQDLRLRLIESNHRKATFLRETVRALNLANVDVLVSRAEDIKVQADLVTLRAVESFERILPVARSLTKSGGDIALLIGSAQSVPAKSILPEVKWEPALAIPCSQSRILLIGRVPET